MRKKRRSERFAQISSLGCFLTVTFIPRKALIQINSRLARMLTRLCAVRPHKALLLSDIQLLALLPRPTVFLHVCGLSYE